FARYWVHNGFVTVEGEKMSKSIGNIRLVHELIKHYPGEVLRLTLLSAHYRQPLNWSEKIIDSNRSFLDGLYRTLYEQEDTPEEDVPVPGEVMEALCDDLNTPRALAALAKIKDKNRLRAGGRLLGILQEDPAAWLGYRHDGADETGIEALLAEREEAR